MALFLLRVIMIAALVGVSLSGCGRFSRQEAPAETPAPVVVAEPEPVLVDLDEVMRSIRHSNNQAEIESAINDARMGGFGDTQVAEAIGMAWLRAPGKRVMISVTFVRFKNASLIDASQLDAAYEYGRTPPAQREAEALAEAAEEEEEEAEEEESEEEEVEPRRRRGWFSWIPGL